MQSSCWKVKGVKGSLCEAPDYYTSALCCRGMDIYVHVESLLGQLGLVVVLLPDTVKPAGTCRGHGHCKCLVSS